MADAANGGQVFLSEEAHVEIHDRLPAGVDAYERGVSVGVLSKAFGLAGLRSGWIATRAGGQSRRR